MHAVLFSFSYFEKRSQWETEDGLQQLHEYIDLTDTFKVAPHSLKWIMGYPQPSLTGRLTAEGGTPVHFSVRFTLIVNLVLKTSERWRRKSRILRGWPPPVACSYPLTNSVSLHSGCCRHWRLPVVVTLDKHSKRFWATSEKYVWEELSFSLYGPRGIFLFHWQNINAVELLESDMNTSF